MEPYITFQDAYLGIYTKSFLWQTDHFNVFIDSGLKSGSSARMPYLSDGRENVLLLTHGHWDHIGNAELTRKHGGKVYAHPADRRLLTDLDWHWELLFGQFEQDFDLPPARKKIFWDSIEATDLDEELSDGMVLSFDNLRFRCIETPGHTSGSVCFLEESTGTLFTGDAVIGNGFFTGTPQIDCFETYLQSMQRLEEVNANQILTDHTEPMCGKDLGQLARESQDCANRMFQNVFNYVSATPEVSVRDAATAIAQAEGKRVGGGTCVSAVAALLEMKNVPQAQECAKKYICGV